MGNRTSYEKLHSEDKVSEDKVCVVFPCYLAINKITHQARCVCRKKRKGIQTDHPDEIVVLTNRFYLPDLKIGFYFFKENNNYYGEPFVLEDCLINMYPAPFVHPDHEKKWEKPITKNLYYGIVERYNWQFDADGKQKKCNATSSVWPFIWLLKQRKELTRLNNEVSILTDADIKYKID